MSDQFIILKSLLQVNIVQIITDHENHTIQFIFIYFTGCQALKDI